MSYRDENTHYCSFCRKSQHQVRKLIAGPEVFICDECVELCTDILDEPDDDKELSFELARGMSTEELARYVLRGRKRVELTRLTMQNIERGVAAGDDEIRENLVAAQLETRRELKRYEDALRIAMTVLGERGQ